MVKQKIELFMCPVCKATVPGIEVDVDEIEKAYKRSSKPVPVIATCPNGHALIVYLYVIYENGVKKVLIRQIKSALASAGKEANKKEEKKKDSLSNMKGWLESF